MTVSDMNGSLHSGQVAGDVLMARRRKRNSGARQKKRLEESGKVVASRHLKWNLYDKDPNGNSSSVAGKHCGRSGNARESPVSARKLAAGLAVMGDHTGGVKGRSDKFNSSSTIPYFSMEGATKWDSGSNSSNAIRYVHSDSRFQQNQDIASISVASTREIELFKARKRIKELEAKQSLSKMKTKHLVRKLKEERDSWMRRQHLKMIAIINDFKVDLEREKRYCQKLDIKNSKLLSDLADARVSARDVQQNYESEKKARELSQDLCKALAGEIEENRAEIEALRNGYAKIRQEVDEERQMMQLTEVWREERAHMKMVEAKMILEEKYSQMNYLIENLKPFYRSLDANADIDGSKLLRQALEFVNIQDMQELSYSPPKSDVTYTIIEDSQTGEVKGREIEHCHQPSSASHISNAYHGFNGFDPGTSDMHPEGLIGHGIASQDISVEGTVIQAGDHLPSYDVEESECSVNKPNLGKCTSSKLDHKHQQDSKPSKPKPGEISLASSEDSKKTGSPLCNSQSNSNGSSIISSVSSDRSSGGVINRNFLNPHILRAMKGCIVWPRGANRHGLRAKLLQAKIESQKMQLRSVLKMRT